MDINLKEVRCIGLILCIFCIVNILSCTNKDQSSVVEYRELSEKVKNGEIKSVEILYSNWDDDVETPQTIEMLKEFYRYKIIINNLQGGGLRFIEEILKYPPIDETNLQNDDFRLGLLFIDKNNKEIYSMYFSTLSPKVRIGNKVFMVSKNTLESIASFIPDKSRKSFVMKIDSWFPEKSEEATKKQ
jgi:hypothetical protein